jgi:TPR repeat protein
MRATWLRRQLWRAVRRRRARRNQRKLNDNLLLTVSLVPGEIHLGQTKMKRRVLALIFIAILGACASADTTGGTMSARAALDQITLAEWRSNYGTLLTDTLKRTSRANLEALAVAGDARAQNLIGEAYLGGFDGFAKDEVEGVRWLRLSEAQGFAGSQSTLGWVYQSGVGGVQVDFAEAARLYGLAAAQDEAGGLVNLGVLYLHGRGVQQDYVEARRLFVLAERHQVAPALANLGVIYENGLGVPADRARAVDYYRRCGTEFCLVQLARMNEAP